MLQPTKDLPPIPPHASVGGTHWACNNRIKKEGGKAECCDCSPHQDCGEPQPSSTERILSKKFVRERWEDSDFLVSSPDYGLLTEREADEVCRVANSKWFKSFITSALETVRQETIDQTKLHAKDEIENARVEERMRIDKLFSQQMLKYANTPLDRRLNTFDELVELRKIINSPTSSPS